MNTCQAEHGLKTYTILKSAEVRAIFGVLVHNRDVTPIRYCGGPLVVACDRGQLRIFTENGRSFDRPHATFARALGSFLLDGLLDSRCLAVLVEILSVISLLLLAALSRGAEARGKGKQSNEQVPLYSCSREVVSVKLLFNRYALREVAGLIDVRPLEDGNVVGEELDRDRIEE